MNCTTAGVRVAAMLLLVAVLTGTVRAAKPLVGKVVRVTDGDSVEVLVEEGRKPYRVTLDGIDSPELPQPFGKTARQFTSDSALGKTVELSVKGRYRSRRLRARVVLPDGRDLAAALTRAGLAWWYPRRPHDYPYKYLEAEAWKARRGLWSRGDARPPWLYREAKRAVQ